MAAILVFFCLFSNLPGWPRFWVKNSKQYFNPNEASQANLSTEIGDIYESGQFVLIWYFRLELNHYFLGKSAVLTSGMWL